MAKSMLIISRQAPWAGPAAREALDIALAGGAFELPLAMLFLDDGVFQLSSEQRPQAVQQKNLSANLQALPMFGVEQLYVSASSLNQRGLRADALALAAKALDDREIAELVSHHDQVITL